MKVDKQALAKHHFWILLGVFALLALVLLIVIPIGVGSQIAAKEEAHGKMVKELDANKSVRSNNYIFVLDEQKKTLGEKREVIHKNMYVRQQELLAYPGDMQEKYKTKEFGSPVELTDRLAFREDGLYMRQYQEMTDLIKPTEFVPDWKTVLNPVAWSDRITPSDEEIWLALEDMCVRREVLNVLHEANMMTARFTAVPPVTPAGGKLPFHQKFASRLWELDITLDKKDRDYVFRGKLKNVSGRRQAIYQLDLLVWILPDLSRTERSKPVALGIPFEALAAGEEATLPEKKITMNQPPTGLYRVEQVLNANTVPIKRLSNLVLGQNAGHRMADKKMQMAKFSQPKAAAATGTAPPTPGPAGPTGLGMTSGPSLGAAGGTSESPRTPNGLMKSRYIELTDQVRRMPIAMVLTLDQVNVPDVLVALENTPRMRFQITQYHWQRSYGQASSQSGASGGPAGPGVPPVPAPPAPGAAGASGALQNEQSTLSLVDLTIYGIANIYERPKDTGAATTSPSTPSAPTGPSAVAPTPPVSPAPTAPAGPTDTKWTGTTESKPPPPPVPPMPPETKPAATKPAETKPADTKPAPTPPGGAPKS